MTIIENSGMLFINQSGRFPITPNRGNKYLLLLWSKFCQICPQKKPVEGGAPAYRLVCAYLTAQGFKLQLQKMDNKTSHDVETFTCEENTRLQYTPPNIDHTNLAEWKIVRGKITSSLALLGFQKTSLSQIGVASLIKQTSPSACSNCAIKILISWRWRHSKGPIPLMQLQWLH
jgi:hypothetical protein